MGEKSSLFSFEVAIKTIFLKRAIVCRVPMVAVRLLNYPSLELNLITGEELQKIKTFVQNHPNSIRTPQILELQHSSGTYVFTQGKSCLIKTKLSELEESLQNIPVYVMLMDILPSVPKLVASFALSLDSVIRKIVRDVSENGIEVPSGQGQRDVYPLYNLMGNKVGEAEMGVRLTSLGITMLQHVSDIAQPEELHEKELISKSEVQRRSSARKISSSAQTDLPKIDAKDTDLESNKENIKEQKNKTAKATDSTQTSKPVMSSKYAQFPTKPVPDTLESTENIFRPPALYYDKMSDAAEKKQFVKQRKAVVHKLRKVDKTLSMSDLENEEKVIVPSSILYQSPSSYKKFISNHTTQTDGNIETGGIASKLGEFPILKALVEEVARLGFQGSMEDIALRKKTDDVKEKDTLKVGSKPWVIKTPKSQRKTTENQTDRKQPLHFGLTNTMRLRMALTKASMKQQRESLSIPGSKRTSKGTKQSSTLGRTFIKSYPPHSKKNIKMVSRACGPDNSMYRRLPPQNINQQTVYLGRMAGYEEATDFEVPSLGHIASDSQQDARTKVDDDMDMEGLMIVKDVRTPRAHSRQSQRSIEIHLPTASTEFTIGRDDDGEWESTVSDKEKLEEAIKKAREKDYDDNEPGFYTPPESTDTSRPQSSAEIRNEKKHKNEDDKIPASDISASENYKYSDDFEDDKTWSANRTPSALTPVNSTMVIKEEDEEDVESDYAKSIAPFPSKSMDSTITTTRTSDFTENYREEGTKQIGGFRSASYQKFTSSDDAIETSSVSRGSIVTALMGKKNKTEEVKVGSITVPGPIPSDSPVIQSMQSTASATMSVEQFPVPKKNSLTSKASTRHQKKTATKNTVHLPKTIQDTASSRPYKNQILNPKYSRMTPSPPSTRRISPISSPESSKERMRRMYHHPGRRTRLTSSGSGSPDFEKPMSPLRRSDSVSSYQPSEISDISNVRLSEDLENLSDILSEEPDSQNGKNEFQSSDDDVPSDLPKTFFGKPKLDPNTKLGYTT